MTLPDGTIRREARLASIGFATWFVAVSAVSLSGLLQALPRQTVAALVVVGIAGLVIRYYRNPDFAALMRTIGLRHLTLFHLWRIPAALAFFWYGSHGMLPDLFVRNAAWGDLLVGLAVIPIMLARARDSSYLAFHLFGLTDFVLAVGTGLTLTLIGVPGMETIATFPIVLIPLFGVCISGASHVIALDLLWRRSRRSDRVTAGA